MSYDALDVAGVDWRDAVHVLNAPPPRVRRHIGSVFQVVAVTPAGWWLAVTLVEENDDEYLVVGARWVDDAEATAMRKITERGAW